MDNAIDLVFVVDGSGSICVNDPTRTPLTDQPDTCDNWKSVQNFMAQFVQQLDVRRSGTRVGLVTFADDARLVFNLNRLLKNKAGLINRSVYRINLRM